MSDAKQLLSPRDVFMHIFTIAMLYGAVVNILIVVFQLINILFPDPALAGYWELESARSLLRFGLATLVIAWPTYLISGWLLQRGYRQNPQSKNLRTRKWLTYFTLFAAALVGVIDLMVLVHGYLSGDFTVRFGLKSLAVLLVSGAVFIRYMGEVVRFEDKKPQWTMMVRPARWISLFVVLALLIAGGVVVGSPAAERARQLDMRRVNDLQYIQSMVMEYASTKGALPSQLTDIDDPVRSVVVPRDPLTAQPYGYEVTGPLAFKICADFAAPSHQTIMGRGTPALGLDVWTHDAGLQCFERTIDKDYLLKRPFDLAGQ